MLTIILYNLHLKLGRDGAKTMNREVTIPVVNSMNKELLTSQPSSANRSWEFHHIHHTTFSFFRFRLNL